MFSTPLPFSFAPLPWNHLLLYNIYHIFIFYLNITNKISFLPLASLMSGYASAAVDIVGKKYVQQAVGLMSVAFGFAHLLAFLVNGKYSSERYFVFLIVH